MKNEGNTLQHIADTLSIRGRTVSSIIVRFKKRGCTENKPLSGNPRSLDPRDERSLMRRLRTTVLVHLGDLTNSYNQHCHRPRQVSPWTAQRCLYPQGYHRSVLKKKMWVGVKSDGMLMISGIKSFLLTRAKFFLDANQRIFIRRRSDKAMSPKYLCSPAKRKLSVMIGGGEGGNCRRNY